MCLPWVGSVKSVITHVEDEVCSVREQNGESHVKTLYSCCFDSCHNFQGKLDALGKEKEEASKEIESLTKQIEELRSNAGMSICDIILANVSPNRLQHCDPVAMFVIGLVCVCVQGKELLEISRWLAGRKLSAVRRRLFVRNGTSLLHVRSKLKRKLSLS